MQENTLLLINRVLNGDKRAEALLYNTCCKILSSAIHKVNNFTYQDKEDIKSNTIAKAFKYLDSYDSNKGVFSTWLYCIFGNQLIDAARMKTRTKRDSNITCSLDDTLYDDSINRYDKIDSGYLSGHEIIEERDLHEEVVRMIHTLKGRYKEICVLRFVDELSYNEISDRLNIPLGTTKGTINRGVKKIKEMAKSEVFFR